MSNDDSDDEKGKPERPNVGELFRRVQESKDPLPPPPGSGDK